MCVKYVSCVILGRVRYIRWWVEVTKHFVGCATSFLFLLESNSMCLDINWTPTKQKWSCLYSDMSKYLCWNKNQPKKCYLNKN